MGSYNIVNVLSAKVIDIHGPKPSPGAWVNIQAWTPDRTSNQWEFVAPVVAFQAGWFHLQNVGTGQLLSHDYAHNAPRLLAAPDSLIGSQHRRQWQYQWTLSHSKCFKSSTANERNSWYLINRLTRTPLSPHFGSMDVSDFAGREDNLAWKLEHDSLRNWKITNRATGCLLQQTGEAVRCTNSKFTQAGSYQSWIMRLLPPL